MATLQVPGTRTGRTLSPLAQKTLTRNLDSNLGNDGSDDDCSYDEVCDSEDEEGLSEFAVTPPITPEPLRRKKIETQKILHETEEQLQQRQNYQETDVYKKLIEVFGEKDKAGGKDEDANNEDKKEHKEEDYKDVQREKEQKWEEEILCQLKPSK